jgi:hypothetical protein
LAAPAEQESAGDDRAALQNALRNAIAVRLHARQIHRVHDMTATEEQQMIHGISGIAQGVNKLLTLFTEMNLQRIKTDEEIINLLKLISRKH